MDTLVKRMNGGRALPWEKITCQGCGHRHSHTEQRCPICLVEQGETALRAVTDGGPLVNIRAYTGLTALQCAQQYQKEAPRLARVGWVAQGQAQKGMTLTVTYGRSPAN